MLNRLPVDDEVGEVALDPTKPVRCVHAVEEGRRPKLMLKTTVPLGASLRDDYAKCIELLKDSEPSVLIVKLKDKRESVPAADNDWAVIVWIPRGTPAPKENLLKHSLQSIEEVMPECRLKEIVVTSKRDLALDKFMAGVTEMTGNKKPIFLDVPMSEGSRVRLWLALKQGMEGLIESKNVDSAMTTEPWFAECNPMKKVPAFIREDTQCVVEDMVIMEYLEDKYSDHGPSLKPETPEERQEMDLLIQIHDLYVASSLDALQEEGLDVKARAAKAGEIWKQVKWLNTYLEEHPTGAFMQGEKATLADLTWFPTAVLLEFLLPRVLGWGNVFSNTTKPFAALAKWHNTIIAEPVFKDMHQQIVGGLAALEAAEKFKPIIDQVAADAGGLKLKYP